MKHLLDSCYLHDMGVEKKQKVQRKGSEKSQEENKNPIILYMVTQQKE